MHHVEVKEKKKVPLRGTYTQMKSYFPSHENFGASTEMKLCHQEAQHFVSVCLVFFGGWPLSSLCPDQGRRPGKDQNPAHCNLCTHFPAAWFLFNSISWSFQEVLTDLSHSLNWLQSILWYECAIWHDLYCLTFILFPIFS